MFKNNKLKEIMELKRDFSLKLVVLAVGEHFFRKKKMFRHMYHFFHKSKYEYIKNYIRFKYGKTIAEFKNCEPIESDIGENSNIWFFWWQGLENAPEVVKMCFKRLSEISIKSNREVIVITRYNFDQYVSIPQFIIEKLNKKIISLTNFSDILRFYLLYEYGGLWIDATVILDEQIDLKEISKYKIYTVKHGKYKSWHVSKGKWSGFVFGSGKQNTSIKYIRDMFVKYWHNSNCLIGYLLIDAIIAVGYEDIDYLKNEIDNINFNNEQVFDLEKKLNNMHKKDENNIFPCEFNKLTYKNHFEDKMLGNLTNYGFIKEKILGYKNE